MNNIIRKIILSFFCFSILVSNLYGQNDIVSIYVSVSREINNLEKQIEQDILSDSLTNFLSNFSLLDNDMKTLEWWFKKIGQLKKNNKIDSLLVDLPILGATKNKAFILNGRFDVYFSHGDSTFYRRYGSPPIFIEKKETRWIFINTIIEPISKIPEFTVQNAKFDVMPSLNTKSIEINSKFILINKPNEPVSQVPIYLRYPMQLKALTLNGKPVEAEINFGEIEGQSVAQLIVPITLDINKYQSVEFDFHYSVSYQYHHFGRKPIGFTTDRGFILWESGWYPRFSAEWKKIPYEMNIVVPIGQKALTSGTLIEHKKTDINEIYTFRTEKEGSPYFVWGQYEEMIHQFGNTKIITWTPSEDGLDPNPMINLVSKIFDVFQQLLPPPNIDQHRLVAVTRRGGYSPTGNLLLQDRYFTTKEIKKAETLDLVAHELSHSWVNSISSPSGEPVFFLAEGLATYLGAKAVEKLRNKNDYIDIWQNNLEKYQSVAYRSIAPLELNEKVQRDDNAMFRAIAYGKGAYLFRKIETLVGEQTVFQALKKTLLEHKGNSFNLDQFLQKVKSLSNKYLESYIENYLHSNSHPDYVIIPESDADPLRRVIIKNLGYISPIPFDIVVYDTAMLELERKTMVLNTNKSSQLIFLILKT